MLHTFSMYLSSFNFFRYPIRRQGTRQDKGGKDTIQSISDRNILVATMESNDIDPNTDKLWQCVATMPKRSCVTSDCDSCKVECSRNGVFSLATLVKIYPDNMEKHVLYHISLEHGFNVLVMVVPFDVPGKKCISTECPKDPNRICPPKLRKPLRKGNFGIVYKGQLPNGTNIVVKKMKMNEFKVEIDMLNKKTRLDIALDVARRSEYYYDIIDQTIVLDEETMTNIDIVAKLARCCYLKHPDQCSNMGQLLNALSRLVKEYIPLETYADRIYKVDANDTPLTYVNELYQDVKGKAIVLETNASVTHPSMFQPHILIDASKINMTTIVLGFKISMSIMIPLTSMQKMAHPEVSLLIASHLFVLSPPPLLCHRYQPRPSHLHPPFLQSTRFEKKGWFAISRSEKGRVLVVVSPP
ncbi:(S)-2-hydroxy-acid oxidase GLO1 [Glycine soja]